MKLFNRREIVFEARDKAGWEAARAALRAAGVEILEPTPLRRSSPSAAAAPAWTPGISAPPGASTG
jgi:hypothetical protein